jgi:hypothetical protein
MIIVAGDDDDFSHLKSKSWPTTSIQGVSLGNISDIRSDFKIGGDDLEGHSRLARL